MKDVAAAAPHLAAVLVEQLAALNEQLAAEVSRSRKRARMA
jgi:hypothetical protein